MAKGFTLELDPYVYIAKYTENKTWDETYIEKPHLTPAEEKKLSEEQLQEYMQKRNSFPELPLVNYTSQYGLGCFEGLKAFPQKDGSLRLFRPVENGIRMENSMQGLMMPVYSRELFVQAVINLLKKNKELGFAPQYDPEWEKEHYILGHSVYVRPFTYSEPGIGLNLSHNPWVIMITTPVGAYFMPGNSKAITTNLIRAFPGGTGNIKVDANYVNSTLAKYRAIAQGYMEALFLDSKEQKYFEEGSSCNIFFLLKDNTLVTPALEDTILPGITRKSVLQLAGDAGIKTEERKISVDEVLSNGKEVFVTGTAAGISYIESITHNGRTTVYNEGKIGEVTMMLLKTLKGIQYGAVKDTYGWMVAVE